MISALIESFGAAGTQLRALQQSMNFAISECFCMVIVPAAGFLFCMFGGACAIATLGPC